MKSIVKENDAGANAIIDGYLAFAKRQRWFADGDLYKNHFTPRVGKRDLIDNFLLPEQEFRCCYCMKRFNHSLDQDATIEHAIPRSTCPGEPFIGYFAMGYPGLNDMNVCHTQDYKEARSRAGQYPHHVAYHNFVVACSKCNERRGNSVIGFPFLLPLNRQHVEYDRCSGRVFWYDDPKLFDGSPEDERMVNRVGLNRPFLKAVRMLWFYGKDHPTETYSTPDTVCRLADRRELIYRAFSFAVDADKAHSLTTYDIEDYMSLETDCLWQEVLKYDYFSGV